MRASSAPSRRRSRLATIVPPVPPPRITISERAIDLSVAPPVDEAIGASPELRPGNYARAHGRERENVGRAGDPALGRDARGRRLLGRLVPAVQAADARARGGCRGPRRRS